MTELQIAKLNKIRKLLDSLVEKIVESPAEINEATLVVRRWKEGNYNINDVRLYEDVPYKCVQAHDSTGNPNWNPVEAPSLWMQYHGTTPESARPWITPMGAHDMYKVGEYMIWTDGALYQCVYDTTYSPYEYAAAWQAV